MTHVVVIAVRAVLVTFLVVHHVFPERFLAFLAHEGHLVRLPQPMVLAFSMTFGAIEPLLATWSSNGNLSVQNMFAGVERSVDLVDDGIAGLISCHARSCEHYDELHGRKS